MAASSALPKTAFLALLLSLLFAMFAGVFHSTSVDLVSHFALVDELMKQGRVRPEDTYIGWSMPNYPPLSHWAAVALGKVVGSGLLALSLISIIAIYFSYYVIGRLLTAEGSISALVVFVALFSLLAPTHSLIGWEVVANFFYPQLVAFALYFLALGWYTLHRPKLVQVAIFSIFFVPIIYLVQPIGGVHFTATFLAIVTIDAFGQFIATRKMSAAHFAAAAVITAVTIATLFLPVVRALLSYSSNDGALDFAFPYGVLPLPFGICLAASLVNLIVGLRSWPEDTIDRAIGAAGVAAGSLMAFQIFALTAFGSGSFYAVKKHGFIVVTLGAINLARLIGRNFRRWIIKPWQSYASALFAFCVTAAVCSTTATINIKHVVAARKFAERFVNKSDLFKPGNTSAYLASVSPTVNMLISTTPFLNNIDYLYHQFGKLDQNSRYLMIDHRADLDPSCVVETNDEFSIVLPPCLRTSRLQGSGTQISFAAGGGGGVFLDQGWAAQEPWGVWGLEHPVIAIQLPQKDYKLTAKARSFLPPSHPFRDFAVLVNDQKVATWSFNLKEPSGERTANILASAIPADRMSKIEFVSTEPLISPQEAGVNSDTRKLGIGLYDLTLK